MRKCDKCCELLTSWVCDAPQCENNPEYSPLTARDIMEAAKQLEENDIKHNISITPSNEEVSDFFKVLPHSPLPQQYQAGMRFTDLELQLQHMPNQAFMAMLEKVANMVGEKIGWEFRVVLREYGSCGTIDPLDQGGAVLFRATERRKEEPHGTFGTLYGTSVVRSIKGGD